MSKELTYSPADICNLFDLPRTTLFRWETLGEISKPKRDSSERRIYNESHLKTIAKLLRKRIATEINTPSRFDAEREYPPPEVQARLCLLEFISNDDPDHALKTLMAWAERHRLGEEVLNFLIDRACDKPIGDPLRRKIWKLLLVQEELAKTSSEGPGARQGPA